MKTKTAIAILAFASIAIAGPTKSKTAYKIVKLSPSEAIVTCQNGADPTYKLVTSTSMLVSCGASLRATWNGTAFSCPKGMNIWADETEAIAGKDDYVYCSTSKLTE